MHAEHDDNAAAASQHAQQPFPNAGMPGGRPDSPPAGAGLGVKEPAMSAEVAFDLERRPVMNSITASAACPTARGSKP